MNGEPDGPRSLADLIDELREASKAQRATIDEIRKQVEEVYATVMKQAAGDEYPDDPGWPEELKRAPTGRTRAQVVRERTERVIFAFAGRDKIVAELVTALSIQSSLTSAGGQGIVFNKQAREVMMRALHEFIMAREGSL